MFTDKSHLLSEIQSALEKEFPDHKYWDFDFRLIQKAMQNDGDPATKNYLQMLRRTVLGKLEERIEKLENQNDQLIDIIHFLFQRLSDLQDPCLISSQIQEQYLPKNIPQTVSKQKRNHQESCHCTPTLTRREIDVFNLLSKGLCAKEIAKILFISETTVITHKKNLKEKFHARNTVELISNVLNASR